MKYLAIMMLAIGSMWLGFIAGPGAAWAVGLMIIGALILWEKPDK